MQIQSIPTITSKVTGSGRSVRGVVESALSHLSDHITRVEVHLSDESSHKTSQNDKRCMMEPASKAGSPSRSLTRKQPWPKLSTALQVSWPD